MRPFPGYSARGWEKSPAGDRARCCSCVFHTRPVYGNYTKIVVLDRTCDPLKKKKNLSTYSVSDCDRVTAQARVKIKYLDADFDPFHYDPTTLPLN